MIDAIIHFKPAIPVLILCAIWIPATVFFIYLEWKRNIQYKSVRILAIFIAMLALLLIVVKPHHNDTAKTDRYILLTKQYDQLVVDSLIKENPSYQIVSLVENIDTKDTELIQHRSGLLKLDGKISHVIGEGLNDTQLALLKQHTYSFIQSGHPLGITQISFPNQVAENDTFSIQGTIRVNELTALQLIGPGGIIDSASFIKDGLHPFKLLSIMKQNQPGNFTLRTINKNRITEDRIPVNSKAIRRLEILVLQNSPSFELRQLKNFLSGQGHSLQIRTQISKNSFQYENVNNQYPTITKLSTQTLSSKDLLLLESSTLEQLGKAELNTIFEAVKEGLGLLVVVNTNLAKSSFQHQHWNHVFVESLKDTIHLQILNSTKQFVLKKNPLALKPNKLSTKIFNHNNIDLSAYHHHGLGKVAVQLLQETYSLRLEGDTIAYSLLWNSLISQTARKEMLTNQIEVSSPFPYLKNTPLSFRLWSHETIPHVSYLSYTVPLIEDTHVEGLWYGKIWPQQTGWQSIMLRDGKLFTFFVSDDHEWTTLRSIQTSERTKAMSKGKIETKQQLQEEEKAIPQVIFYILFLLSIGLLWLVPEL